MRTVTRLLLFTAWVAVAGCGRSPNEPKPAPPEAAPDGEAAVHAEPAANTVTVEVGMLRDLRITTRPVESRQGGEQIALLGELGVDERRYAEVGAPVAARVTRLIVNVGQTVLRGQALAELTSPELGKARAEYLSAVARRTLADAALERKRGLAAERIVPLREVQEAESAAAEARAGVRSAGAAVAGFGVDLPTGDGDEPAASTFLLRAPVAGSVIDRVAVVGRMLDPATPAFRIGDLSTLWLTVHAFERDAVRIQQGAATRIAFPALPGQDFRGTVAVVGRHVEPESRTVPIRIDVRNTGNHLRPGMSGTASLPVGGSDMPILAVPVAAVQRVRNDWCVFLPRDERTFEIRVIGRGRDLAGEVEVLSGLRAGETIVVDGAFLLKAQAERGAGHEEHGGGA